MSAVKMPEAGEEAKRIAKAYYDGCFVHSLTDEIADIQRATLMAAAKQVVFPGVRQELERLAEQAGRER